MMKITHIWNQGLWPRELEASVAVPPAVRVSSQSPLAREPRQSSLSANDKGNNDMILEAMHRSPGI